MIFDSAHIGSVIDANYDFKNTDILLLDSKIKYCRKKLY